MKRRSGIAALIFAAPALFLSRELPAQTPIPVRRALPVQELPVARGLPVQEPRVARAIPVDTPAPTAEPTVRRALPVPDVTDAIPAPTAPPSSAGGPPVESAESPEQNQLNYANGLFGRKLYDLAVPEYEKFLGLYPTSSARATALFYMGQAYRAINRTAAARSSFQTVLRDFPDGELAGPASYGLAEISFNEKDYASALPLFHRAESFSRRCSSRGRFDFSRRRAQG